MSSDQTIIGALSQHLMHPVHLLSKEDCSVQSTGVKEENVPNCLVTDRGAQGSTVAIQLSSGNWASWDTSAMLARPSLNHAKTVLQLQDRSDERDRLVSESDALATQVINDFEELSLLRSLASATELPDAGVTVAEMTIRCLRPLTLGVGANSIAAVLLADDDKTRMPPCWSNEALVSSEKLSQLIDENCFEAEQRPVVRNRSSHAASSAADNCIDQFVLLQCRSEGRLHGWLVACNRLSDESDQVPWVQRGFTTVQATLLETATHQLAAQLHNMRLLRQKESLYTDVVRTLVNAVEARDPYTSGHSERVARFARCLSKVMGESDATNDRMYLTGLLHDVGKIAVPDGVLRKPGDLDEQERAIIETHAEAGWRILHELEALRNVLPGVLYHHERFDGKGYPDGLAGKNIPLEGRILAVCDSFDAMTSDRPYRKGMSLDKAAGILKGGSGRYWDPVLIDAFVDHLELFAKIRSDHRPREHAVRPTPLCSEPIA
ncbi:MAG: HD-GYP domain-containing protein [Rubripirellula sp.]|nr:HD-GYP domain-containing protein [Rubripirellula sp.]